jgi:ATP-dependent protease ClpP protease subunit
VVLVAMLTWERDIAIHAKEILRVREKLNQIYVKHLTKPHTLEEIGMVPQ